MNAVVCFDSSLPTLTRWGNKAVQSTYVTDEERLCAREIGRRWAAALERRYVYGSRVKLICRDFNAAERTVKGWLAGQSPQQQHVARAINLFGDGFAAEVYMAKSLSHMMADSLVRLQELRRELDRLNQAIAAVEATLRR